MLEKVLQLFSESGQVRLIRILNISSSHDRLEELSLQNNASRAVHIFRLNAQLCANIRLLLLAFVFLFEVRVVCRILKEVGKVLVAVLAVEPVHQVEFSNFTGAQKGEMVLLALVVDSIEIG